MFNIIRRYCVFTNRLGKYYVVSVLNIDTIMSIYVGNAVDGYSELQFNLG